MLLAVWIIAVVWLSISALHALLSSWKPTSQAYHNFLNHCGLAVSPGHVKAYWTGCPGWVHRLGSLPGLRYWFDMGSIVSTIIQLLSLPILALLLVNALRQPAEQQILKPVIPGVNVPWSQMVYFAITIFVCAVLHELGHAVAAVKEQVRVDGYGIFILLIYPGAYVDLHDEHMAVISGLRRLRIFSAGVWHNFVLALFGYALILGLPFLMAPLFAVNMGAVVINVSKDSALYGQLPVGTHITAVNRCPVPTVAHLSSCLGHVYSMDMGYCLPLEYVKKQRQRLPHPAAPSDTVLSPLDCCAPSPSHICFTYESSQMHQGQVCLNARNVTASSSHCRSPRHCLLSNDNSPDVGNSLFVCAKPQLDPSTGSRLLRVQHSEGKDVMFLGNPYEVFYQVRVSNYSPRWPWMSILNYLPIFLEMCGLYLVSISSALCFLNIVPVYYLDGHWVLITLIEHFLPTCVPNQRARNKLTHLILTSGTLLLLANILVALAGALA